MSGKEGRKSKGGASFCMPLPPPIVMAAAFCSLAQLSPASEGDGHPCPAATQVAQHKHGEPQPVLDPAFLDPTEAGQERCPVVIPPSPLPAPLTATQCKSPASNTEWQAEPAQTTHPGWPLSALVAPLWVLGFSSPCPQSHPTWGAAKALLGAEGAKSPTVLPLPHLVLSRGLLATPFPSEAD